MRKITAKHWPFLVAGPVLSSFLIVFWFFNQNYLSNDKNPLVLLLENPILTFGLIIFGSFISASIFGDFSIKTPITYDPLIYSFLGGVTMGIGAVIASMSAHSVVLFNLTGIFNLTAFMVTKGWIYAIFMILGGFLGSKVFVYCTLRTNKLKKEFYIPDFLKIKRNQQVILSVLVALFTIFTLTVLLFSRLSSQEKGNFVLVLTGLVFFGLIVERGTICMSSMLKEWFISRTAYVWRSVLLTIMLLALFYFIGLKIQLYKPIELERCIEHLNLLMFGSFLMGAGFIFADGCFIGTLWKIGQGNIVNIFGFWGMLLGIGISKILIEKFMHYSVTGQVCISNYLQSLIPHKLFLVILWIFGGLLLLIFKPKHYRY